MTIDTISAFVPPTTQLPDRLFDGGNVTSDFSDVDVTARLWSNPKGEAYLPRVTYWRGAGVRAGRDLLAVTPLTQADTGLLKIEFSVPKLLDLGSENPTEADIARALSVATDFVRERFDPDLPHLSEWGCQRIDYAWDWPVVDALPAYMSVLHKLRLKNYSRHPFDASEGVVWKARGARGRWVKFYNKTLEMEGKRSPRMKRAARVDEVLRYEVSNYRDAVKYMAERWFGCRRSVGEMAQPGRALYMMSVIWDTLGLGRSDEYGHEELLLSRLRDAFGLSQIGTARHVLSLITDYGTAAYDESVNLVSKSAYYRWRTKLLEHGLLTVSDTQVVAALPALHLPTETVFADCVTSAQNLGKPDMPTENPPEKIPGNLSQTAALRLEYLLAATTSADVLRGLLGLAPTAPESPYLIERWLAYAEAANLAADRFDFDQPGAAAAAARALTGSRSVGKSKRRSKGHRNAHGLSVRSAGKPTRRSADFGDCRGA